MASLAACCGQENEAAPAATTAGRRGIDWSMQPLVPLSSPNLARRAWRCPPFRRCVAVSKPCTTTTKTLTESHCSRPGRQRTHRVLSASSARRQERSSPTRTMCECYKSTAVARPRHISSHRPPSPPPCLSLQQTKGESTKQSQKQKQPVLPSFWSARRMMHRS